MIRWLRHMLLWCALAGGVCAGGVGGDGALRVFESAAMAPADLDLLICVQDAGKLRRSEMGGAAGAMVELALGEGETARAWSALAEQLGWSREEAFDRLLGSRVALVARGMPQEGQAGFRSWALLSEVSLDTEKRLRERLRVAPRAIVAGHTVLAVEGGAYELTAERRAKHATLILAPSDRSALFDELLPLLAKGPTAPLSATHEFAEVRALGGGELLMFVRTPGAWAGLVARREGMRLTARTVAAREPGDEEVFETPPWDCGAAQAAGEEALFWTIERALPATFASTGITSLLSGLPVMRLRERAADLLGDFLGVWVTAAPEGLPQIAAALEVQGMEGSPAQADALMAELLRGVGLDGVEFAGVEPRAVRRVDLSASAVIRESGLWNDGPEARWTFIDGGEGAPARAWWVMGIGEGAFDLARRGLGAAPRGEARDVRAWVGMGGAKPAAALEALRGAGLSPGGPVLAASLVRELRWSVAVEQEAAGANREPRLKGSIEATLEHPPAASSVPSSPAKVAPAPVPAPGALPAAPKRTDR